MRPHDVSDPRAIESVTDELFDPYAVLAVARDTSQAEIRAAYERAKAKYDPALVSEFAYAALEHFKTKAKYVERAYQMLLDR